MEGRSWLGVGRCLRLTGLGQSRTTRAGLTLSTKIPSPPTFPYISFPSYCLSHADSCNRASCRKKEE